MEEQDWKDLGFDTTKEPFERGNIRIYKNYCRDASGKFDGYIMRVESDLIESKEDFTDIIAGIYNPMDLCST